MKKLAILSLLVFSFNVVAFSQTPVDLDTAMKNATKEIAAKVPAKSKVAVVSFTADSEKMSEFLINGLVAELVNSGKFSVMDRSPKNMALINAELTYQYSGEVDDDSMVSLGKKLGAQYLIVGSFEQFGGIYQFNVRAVSVETGEIPVLSSVIIASSAKTADLLGEEAVPSSGDDYLRMIAQCQNKLNSIERDKDTEFQKSSTNIKARYQKQLNDANAQNQEDWESTEKYNARIEKETNTIIQKRDTELKALEKTIAIKYDDLENTVTVRKTKLEKDLQTVTFTVDGSSVQVLFGAFERDTDPQYWPVSVKSLDKILNYTWNGKYEVKAADVKTEYKMIEAAKAANTFSGVVTYAFIKGATANTYDKKVLSVQVSDTATGNSLLTVPVNLTVGTVSATLQVSGNTPKAGAAKMPELQDEPDTDAVAEEPAQNDTENDSDVSSNSLKEWDSAYTPSSDPFMETDSWHQMFDQGKFAFNIQQKKIEGETASVISFTGKLDGEVSFPWVAIGIYDKSVVQKIQNGDNMKFKVIGDGKKYKVSLHLNDGVEYEYVFTTKKDTVMEVKAPYSKFIRGSWCTKYTKFSKDLVTGLLFATVDGDKAETRALSIFDIVVY